VALVVFTFYDILILSMTDEELKEIVIENNELLKKIRGGQRRSRIFTVLYWLVVIGIALGFFYYLRPIFNKLLLLLQGIVGAANNATSSLADVNLLQNLIDQLGGK